jgi:hypothetical protein
LGSSYATCPEWIASPFPPGDECSSPVFGSILGWYMCEEYRQFGGSVPLKAQLHEMVLDTCPFSQRHVLLICFKGPCLYFLANLESFLISCI